MILVAKSGYYYPNRLAFVTFNALIELMDRNGFNAMLNLAHLGNYTHTYPPNDLDKGVDFADISIIQVALEEMYGIEGGQLFIKRAGKTTFRQALYQHGALAGVNNPAFRSLPLELQLRIGTQALARIMTQLSDQMTTVEESEAEIRYIVQRCPHCWGRVQAAKPVCVFGTGLLEEGVKYFCGGVELRVEETSCMAMGEPACTYTITKQPVYAKR